MNLKLQIAKNEWVQST